MKKSDLTDLIERKRILKESLNIIKESYDSMDEVGGFDDPEIMSQYHGNYYDELVKIFFRFDDLSDELVSSMAKIMDDQEVAKSKQILTRYKNFMDIYVDFLRELQNKVETLSSKRSIGQFPGTDKGAIGLNEESDI